MVRRSMGERSGPAETRSAPFAPPWGPPFPSADAEVAIRLPKEAAPAFPPLLRTLEAGPARTLGVASFGLSVTTLEEVFLRVSESAGVDCGEADPAEDRAATGSAGGGRAAQQPSGKQVAVGLPPAGAGAAPADLGDAELDVDRSEFVVVNVPHRCYLRVRHRCHGWPLVACALAGPPIFGARWLPALWRAPSCL